MTDRFPSYYAAKFAREQKPNPSQWLIAPDHYGWYKLIQIGGFNYEKRI